MALTFEAEAYEKFLGPAMEFAKSPSSLGYKYCFKGGDFPDEIRRRTKLVEEMAEDPESAFPDAWSAIETRLRPLESIGRRDLPWPPSTKSTLETQGRVDTRR